MIPFLCDDPDRIAARIFRTLRSDCPCCTFWRGAGLGIVVGMLIGATIALTK